VLTLHLSDGSSLPLNFSGGYTQANFTLGSDGMVGGVACFAAGTRILMADGERAVEDVRVGDLVPDLIARGLRRVVWVGCRTVVPTEHRRPADVLPVRVRKDAFGPGMPHRDLVLSPEHCLLRRGVLVPVRRLIDGRRVVQEHADTVTYWHMELDAHGLLLAEGAPAESFLDTGNRDGFTAAGVRAPLHARFAAARREAAACAPLLVAD